MIQSDRPIHTLVFEQCRTLTDEVVQYLEHTKKLKRSLSQDQMVKAHGSVWILVLDTLCAHALHPYAPVSISKRPSSYTSKHPEYRGVSFRMHVQKIYSALIEMGYLQRLKDGYFDKEIQAGKRETYTLTDQLIAYFGMEQPVGGEFSQHVTWFDYLIVSPQTIPNLEAVKITTKNPETKRKEVRLPKRSDALDAMEERLQFINESYANHWIDLELPQDAWSVFSKGWEDSKGNFHTLNLTKRRLYRIFHDDNLKTGGRFYGGWWQEIPDKYRADIIIDGKRTIECDFSNMHPSILYAKEGLPIPDDAYSPIAGEHNRDIVKPCFNAMLNASTEMSQPPRDVDIKPTGYNWEQLKARIRAFHEPITHYFCKGAGMWLMREDSEMAEQVMLHFIKMGYPCLPVHDSFIVHNGLATELEDKMKDVFTERYGVAPKIKLIEAHRSVPGGQPLTPISNEIEDVLRALDAPHEHRLELHYRLRQ